MEEDPGAARRVLGHTHHPTLGYPYAITAINLTASIFELTTANQLDRQYIHMLADGGGVVLFYKVFGEHSAGPGLTILIGCCLHVCLQISPLNIRDCHVIQWNLSIEDTTGPQVAVLYTVEPLHRGHHRDPAGCPVYSGTSP